MADPNLIPWARPYLGQEEADAVARLLSERRLSMGAEVRAFEIEAARLAGRKHAIAVSNGTAALDVALRLAGVRTGDEVLVSSLSYVATVNAIVHLGAVPVFCDVDPARLSIDPMDVQRRINERTRALLVSDLAGSPVDYARLVPLCRERGVQLVLDGAQSLGASFCGRPALAHGLVSTTSFHTAKAFLCGEGGMVFTDRNDLAEHARRLRGQGEIPGRKYVHDTLAFNLRMTEIQGAIGRLQLARFDQVMARRRELAERYAHALSGVPGVTPLGHLAEARPAWFAFVVRVPEREAVAALLAEHGVETRPFYPLPAYAQPIPEYAAFDRSPRLHAERASREALSLPMFYELRDDEVDFVAATLSWALARVRGEAAGAPPRVAA